MSSLLVDLLSQKQPQFQTHQALIVLDAQNDFLLPDGKLPVSSRSGFLARIKRLVPVFRDTAGDIIWVRTIYDKDRPANDGTDESETIVTNFEGDGSDNQEDAPEETSPSKDGPSSPQGSKSGGRAMEIFKKVTRKAPAPAEPVKAEGEDPELFLSTTASRQPCCVPGSKGAEFVEDIKKSIDNSNDVVITKSHYSAFNSTTLLMTLRMRLITELYICGCMTNLSVYATALDAARHGLTINIVEDCVGYRKATRHREALRQMADVMGAYTATSTELLSELAEQDPEADVDTERIVSPEPVESLNSMVNRLSLSDASSVYSTKDVARGSVEHRRGDSGTVESTARASPVATPVLRNKASGKLQKKPPQSPTTPSGAETGERTLKYKRSKIRMRKRDSSAGPKERTSMDQPEALPQETQVQTQSPRANADKETPKFASSPNVSTPRSSQDVRHAPQVSSPKASPLGSARNSARNSGADALTNLNEQQLLAATLGSSIQTQDAQPDDRPRTTSVSKHKSAVDKIVGEGDSYLSTAVVPLQLASTIFSDLLDQVRWQTMYHQTGSVPRLVCVQGHFGEDGSMPIYRHPTDHSLPLLHYSPAVETVRSYAEQIVQHPLNHVLIQLYRSGQDYISEHSDKTLDIVRGSSIVNVSFGAQRTMRLRTKKSALDQQSISFSDAARQTHRVPLPHNSAFVLGQETNMRWLHGINPDKRPQTERSPAEKAFSGMRISLTFRHIGTFLNPDSTLIWGQGAAGKSKDTARPIVNNDPSRAEVLVRAFSKENQATEFNWAETYGSGFDIVSFRTLPGDRPGVVSLFLSNDRIENEQVRLYLDEASIQYATIDPPTNQVDDAMGCTKKVFFRDCDAQHTEVLGAVAILLYLDRLRPFPHRVTADNVNDKPVESRSSIARTYEMLALLTDPRSDKSFVRKIEALIDRDGYIAGRGFSFADCAVFPVLEQCWEVWKTDPEGEAPRVEAYIERMRRRIVSRTTKR